MEQGLTAPEEDRQDTEDQELTRTCVASAWQAHQPLSREQRVQDWRDLSRIGKLIVLHARRAERGRLR